MVAWGPYRGGCSACLRASKRDVITAQQRHAGPPRLEEVGGVPSSSCSMPLPEVDNMAVLGRTLRLSCPRLFHPSLWEGVCGDSHTSLILATLPGSAELCPDLLGRLW